MAEKIKQIFFYIILFLFIWAITLNEFSLDYDLWARLIIGKYFVQTGHILKHDFLSYTPTHILYDHEWGSSIIFYLTQHFFGGVGLIILQTILIFLVIFFITKIIELRGLKNTYAYNFLFYFFALGSMNYVFKTPVRCQLFSFLFFTIFLYLLELSRKEKIKDKYLMISLPLIMVIWNNLHGGCVAGIGLIGLYTLGEFLNKKPFKRYLYSLLFSLSVFTINPWGFDYLPFLIKANSMARSEIVEWWGLFYKYNMHKYIKLKFLILLFTLIESGFVIKSLTAKKYDFDKTKFLVLIITLILAIQHIKLIPFLIISASCFLYDDFYTAFNFMTFNLFNKIALYKDSFVYICIMLFIIGQFKTANYVQFVGFEKYPVLSTEFIKINGIKGNVLTNFGLGSYVSYKLYPHNKIYMDGRYEEVYYDEMIPLLKKLFLMKSGWDELLKKYPPDIIIVERRYPVFNYLRNSSGWKFVYDEDWQFALFVRAKNAKKKYKQPSFDRDYYLKNTFSTDINFKK